MIRFSHVSLNTFAYELPPLRVTSDEIEQMLASVYDRLKLPQGRLELMTGIKERRFWNPGTRPSEAATLAGKRVLVDADISPDDIECLIFTSVSRDMMEPATASFIHDRLGLHSNCLVFDISNACLGFLDGMVMLGNMIELGQVRNGLVVSGETAEDLFQSTIKALNKNGQLTRKSIKSAIASLTIGSGAVGVLMQHATIDTSGMRLVHGTWQANTRYSNLCHGGTNEGDSSILMQTDSEQLLVQGVETAADTWKDFSSQSGWSAEEVDCFFCHQVGTAHAKLLFERLCLETEKNYQTLPFLGNIGSVSAPITLAMAIENQFFKPGQKGALLGIGSGINCLMLGIEWSDCT